MLTIFWVVTPLQSAIFNTASITRSTPLLIEASRALLPIELQATTLKGSFLNTGYGTAWLQQRLHPYTTMEFATLPFHPVSVASSTSKVSGLEC